MDPGEVLGFGFWFRYYNNTEAVVSCGELLIISYTECLLIPLAILLLLLFQTEATVVATSCGGNILLVGLGMLFLFCAVEFMYNLRM